MEHKVSNITDIKRAATRNQWASKFDIFIFCWLMGFGFVVLFRFEFEFLQVSLIFFSWLILVLILLFCSGLGVGFTYRVRCHSVAQSGLRVTVLLSWPPKSWSYILPSCC